MAVNVNGMMMCNRENVEKRRKSGIEMPFRYRAERKCYQRNNKVRIINPRLQITMKVRRVRTEAICSMFGKGPREKTRRTPKNHIKTK